MYIKKNIYNVCQFYSNMRLVYLKLLKTFLFAQECQFCKKQQKYIHTLLMFNVIE